MEEKLILTEEEEKITKYCEDFCPIHEAIKNYNMAHKHIICCPTEMCEKITNTYVLNLREQHNI